MRNVEYFLPILIGTFMVSALFEGDAFSESQAINKPKLVIYLDDVAHLGAHGVLGYPKTDAEIPPDAKPDNITLKISKSHLAQFRFGVINPDGIEQKIPLDSNTVFTNLIKKQSDVPADAKLFFTSTRNIIRFSQSNISVNLDVLKRDSWLSPPYMIDVVYMPDGEKSKVEDFFPFILVE